MKILLVDDEVRVVDELSELLTRLKHDVSFTHSPREGLVMLRSFQPEIVMLDIKMPELDGLEFLRQAKQNSSNSQFIMMSGHGDMDTVVKAMRLGAFDYLKKPFRRIDVTLAIERADRQIKQEQKIIHLTDTNSLISKELETAIEKELIGNTPVIQNALTAALNAAKYKDVNVHITGESGTGKEIIARIIHRASNDIKGQLCPVNCAAIPESLLESEFFGHKKGAFTGAMSDKKGFFELAHQGTIFLDEVADMPLNLQSKLLRVLEDKRIKKIGDEREIAVSFRIISATSAPVQDLIANHKFRLDLYHRLNTIIINLPPLRERVEDIETLVHHFIAKFTTQHAVAVPQIKPSFFKALVTYSFPGNVRELKNLVERALIISPQELNADSLPFYFVSTTHRHDDFNLDYNERQLIESCLDKCAHNQTKAAQMLGISRHSLIRRLQKYKLS